MLAAKLGDSIRLREIRKALDEDWEVQWLGTSTNETYPRYSWKFSPGWIERQSGVTRYSNTHRGHPALGQVRKEGILTYFPGLMIKATGARPYSELHSDPDPTS